MNSYTGSDSVGGGVGSQITRIPSVPAHFGYILGSAAGQPPFIDDTHGN